MGMAQQPATTTTEPRQPPKAESPDKPQKLVVVELAKRRSPEQIRRLRKGRGKLMTDIDDVVADLTQDGTIKADAQPVVIIVREAVPLPLPWPLNAADFDTDDDDDDDDDDED
jgi:uncharacterized protein DUF6200